MQDDHRKLKSNILNNSILAVITSLSPIIILSAISKSFGVEEYSRYATAISFSWLFLIFSDMGISIALTEKTARSADDELRKILYSFFGLKLIFSVSISPLYFWFFSVYVDNGFVLKISTYFLFLFGALNLSWFFQGKEITTEFLIDNLIAKSILILSTLAGFIFEPPLEYYVIIQVAVTLLLIILGLRRLSRLGLLGRIQLNFTDVSDNFMVSLPFYISRLPVTLYENCSVLFVSRFVDDTDTGQYAMLLQLYRGAAAAIGAFSVSLLPYMARTRDIRTLIGITVTLCGLIMVFYPILIEFYIPLVYFFFGDGYGSTESLAGWWYLNVMLFSICSFLGYPYLSAKGRIDLGHKSMFFGSFVYVFVCSALLLTESITIKNMTLAITASLCVTAVLRITILVVLSAFRARKLALMLDENCEQREQ